MSLSDMSGVALIIIFAIAAMLICSAIKERPSLVVQQRPVKLLVINVDDELDRQQSEQQ